MRSWMLCAQWGQKDAPTGSCAPQWGQDFVSSFMAYVSSLLKNGVRDAHLVAAAVVDVRAVAGEMGAIEV